MGLSTRGVRAFLLMAFGLAWGAILIAHFVLDLSIGDPRVQILIAIPTAFAPAIAAVIVRRWVTREGFRDAGLNPRLRMSWFYYLLAWLGPMLVFAVTVGLAVSAGMYRPGSPKEIISNADLGSVGLTLMAPLVLLPVYWGEEFGWRGYLQLRVSRSPVRAAFITGIIWALWHYPLVFTDYVDYSNPFLGIVTWTPSLMAQAIILAWLFLRSGTVWVPCLAHAGNNLIIGNLATPVLVEGGGLNPYTLGLLEVIPLAAICGWILATGRLTPPGAVGAREPAAMGLRASHD